MNRTVTTQIDPERCIGCGLCVRVCPSGTLSMQGDRAVVTGIRSLGCGHCAAICPADAVRVTALENESLDFQTFSEERAWLPFGEYDTAQLVRLLRSRRSCRNYSDKPVSPALLEDLVRIGITAPSGTNSQKWTFTLLPTRDHVMALGERIGLFFRKLNRLAEKPWLRNGLKWLGKSQLDGYYREYYESVRDALAEYENTGRDRLFHGAAAAIIVGAGPGGSCPAEDALLATQNILLGAHAMGLGSCLIGFAVEAMKNDRAIARSAGIPDEESVCAVIALGWPDAEYRRLTGRKRFTLRYSEK
ncbi:nitroreductase [Desulfonema ishimotonii]|uniref:Nitroreductase n=1 Tax=Desulfonema ishimotonii TaxID=45657 RepID=A0A401FWX6_9BACT|nr:nitroreductase family protein [Desulfonema ishimotonii]GBC61502.1 nitroreductase [Desulfonema ishimotonii]